MPRNERFTADYQFRIQNLLQTLSPNIIQKQREMPRETKMANQSLAIFVKVTIIELFRIHCIKQLFALAPISMVNISNSMSVEQYSFIESTGNEQILSLILLFVVRNAKK
jgi:hypothetical protein